MADRNAYFDVSGIHIDGRDRGTLTVEINGERGWVIARPHRGREYRLPLATAFEVIAWRAAKEEASSKVS